MSRAVLRCCCLRCAGHVIWTSAVAYLDAHQLAPGEYVLENEAVFMIDHGPSRRPLALVGADGSFDL